MIKNIIFDFGAVLIPIDPAKTHEAFTQLGATEDIKEQESLFAAYEKGEYSTADFLKKMQAFFFRKKIFTGDIKAAWNEIIYTAIPEENIALLKKMSKNYRLFLLSNTNAMNIEKIKDITGPFYYKQFSQSFEKIYFSYEHGMRKPEAEFYQKVLDENELKAEESLFIDDLKSNIIAAKNLDIETWHFKTEKESILDLGKVLSTRH